MGNEVRVYKKVVIVKSSTKAVLLSLFLFPGSGHVYLKKYAVGGVLITASLAAIYYLLLAIVDKATRVSEMILSGEVRLDVISITQALSKQTTAADSQSLKVATAVLVVCFLVGILDAYRLGRASDKIDRAAGS